MKKLKLLTLTAAGISILSAASFAQNFPVTYTGVVTEPAPEYILLVNGLESDAINMDFGTVEKGNSVYKSDTISIKKGEDFVPQSEVSLSLKNETIENNIGKIASRFDDSEAMDEYTTSLKTSFEALSAGTFNAATELVVEKA